MTLKEIAQAAFEYFTQIQINHNEVSFIHKKQGKELLYEVRNGKSTEWIILIAPVGNQRIQYEFPTVQEMFDFIIIDEP